MALLLFFPFLFFPTIYQKSLTRPPRTPATTLIVTFLLPWPESPNFLIYNEVFGTVYHYLSPPGSRSIRNSSPTVLNDFHHALQLSLRHSLSRVRHLRGHWRCSHRCQEFDLRLSVQYIVPLFSNREDVGPEECSHVINSLSTRLARHRTLCHSWPQQSTRFYSYLERTYCYRNLRIDREGRPFSFIPSSTNVFPLH